MMKELVSREKSISSKLISGTLISQNNKAAPVISRDEMNLAEFPLSVLSTRTNNSIKTLEFRDTIRKKGGELVNREWIITGADKFGLPTASDEEVLLGLLKLTVDEGISDRKIYFTRYDLLKTLRWTTEGRSYTRLQKALDRLTGVRIKATNAFFDNELKSHSTRNFGLIDAYEINSGRDNNKPSYFTWSEVLFKSFQVGFIKKLDLDYYLTLQSSVSKRLYRFLDKHFWYKSVVNFNLFVLSHEKIGVSRNYKFASSLRQQLDPAFEELIKGGFLEKVEYQGRGSGTEVTIYASKGSRAFKDNISDNSSQTNATQFKNSIQQRSNGEVKESGEDLFSSVKRKLLERGIVEPQIVKLLSTKGEEQLSRIGEIIKYFDYLVSSKSYLISKSPVGFLYRAVENSNTFVLPGKTSQDELPLNKKRSNQIQNKDPKKENLDAQYLVARKKLIDSAREEVEPHVLTSIRKEVLVALQKLKSHISPDRFDEAINHAVDEKLAKLFDIPSFAEWVRDVK